MDIKGLDTYDTYVTTLLAANDRDNSLNHHIKIAKE